MKRYQFFIASVMFFGVMVLTWAHLNARNSITYTNPVAAAVPKAGSAQPISLPPLPAGESSSTVVSAPKPVVATPYQITADAYLVGNAATGEIYLSKNVTRISQIASISKLFTSLVAYENMQPTQEIEITQPMLDVYSNSYGFNLGEKFTLNELFFPLLLESNNNIAEGLAMAYGYDSFIKKMNSLAATLDLPKTHFQDASGLSDGNVSDAQDLFKFGQYLYASQRWLLALTTNRSWSFATTTDHGSHVILSTDQFIGDPNLIGGKTGRTDAAGETMLTIFDHRSGGKDYPVVVVVLHSDLGKREIDSSVLEVRANAIIDKIKSNP